MTDKNRQKDNRYMPHVGRARGLITVGEQTRWQEKMQLRRRGIWSPATPVVSYGRAKTLALLREASSRNAVWTHNHVTYQRRGRGL